MNGKFLWLWVGLLLIGTRVKAQRMVQKPHLIHQVLKLDSPVAFHLTDSTEVMRESRVDLVSPYAWLYFDNVRPSAVIHTYLKSISVNGKPAAFGPKGNSRIAIYKQGAVVIPQSEQFEPLETFTLPGFKGAHAAYHLYDYYTNKPDKDFPSDRVRSLEQENAVRSFRLKKGYMLTVATQPDGTGFSRVYVADTGDLAIGHLPAALDRRIAYIRVFAWQWPSKKGWCGVRRKDMIRENGRNKQDNEIDLTQSTWFYSWGATNPVNVNAEFVPMKWGYGGSMKKIDAIKYATHLLGYNEPDRPDQANMTVEQALEEWPQLMKSGLRLGSPAVSGKYSWLYRFLDECDKRNYRVDYVTVHAYWGAQQAASPKAWYEKLREIHLRTHRPIWLTEFNNGANWTKESWPSDKAAAQAKQLRELSQIIHILDTASFIERYSIYNWVEDKRAVILDSVSYKRKGGKKVVDQYISQSLTPAGWFYRNDHPGLAYHSRDRFIPTFHLNGIPDLSIAIKNDTLLQLCWNVSSEAKMLDGFHIERSGDGRNFRIISNAGRAEDRAAVVTSMVKDGKAHGPFYSAFAEKGSNKKPYRYAFPVKKAAKQAYYRVVAIAAHDPAEQADSSVSNVVGYRFFNHSGVQPLAGTTTVLTSWQPALFKNAYAQKPVIILGSPTNHNKYPQTVAVRNISDRSFEFRLSLWNYLGKKECPDMDSVSYLILPKTGSYDLKGIKAEAGSAKGITTAWKKVAFETPFDKVPVVFVTRVTAHSDTASSVRIRNVSREGFEAALQYEAAVRPPEMPEEIQYLAAEPGSGKTGKYKIQVGVSERYATGDFFHPYKIDLAGFDDPVVFTFMQTTADQITAALRIRSSNKNSRAVFKEREQSEGLKDIKPEKTGWMIWEPVK